MARLISVAFAVALSWTSTQAQANPPRAMSEAEFLAAFDRDNPRFALLDADVARADARVSQHTTLPNPSLILEREQVFGSGDSSAETSIGIGWAIDLSGRRGRRAQGARHSVSAARLRGEATRITTRIGALVHYRRAAHARLLVTLLEAERAPLQRVRDALRKRVAAGDVAGYDLTRLDLELASYDDKLTSARASLAAARGALTRLLGDAARTPDASDPLRLPAAPHPASNQPAVASQPAHRALASELRAARALDAAAARWWIPSLSVSLGYKNADAASGYFAGLSLDLPLFTRGKARRRTARAVAQQTRARMRMLERNMPTAVRTAHAHLARTIQHAQGFERSMVKRVGMLVVKATSRYRGGEGSIVELLDAYRLARETRVRHLSLRHAAKQAELSLWRARGRMPGSP